MTIRLAEASDAAAIAEIYHPFVASTLVSFEMDPPDEAQMRERIETTLIAYPWLVAERDGHVAGYAYATAHRTRLAYQWSVDTAVYVHPDAHRQGLGRDLYTSLFRVLVAQRFCNAYAGITLPNPASVGLHEAVGFRPLTVYRHVGYKFGAWHDVGWWERLLQPYPPHPEPPLRLAEVTCADLL